MKKACTLIAFLLVYSVIPAIAQDPFSDDFLLKSETISENKDDNEITTTTEKTLQQEEKKEAKKDKNEYPCEGTINCQYGQHCRIGPWGDIIAIIPPGTKVTITGKEGDWYTIEYNGRKCYLHYSLVDTPTTPAYDGYHPYAYADVNPNYKKEKPQKKETKSNNKEAEKKIDTTKDINGPEVPECLLKGLEAAKKSQWNVSHKCLQFSGTIAEKAGAKVSYSGAGSQPQIAWSKTKDTTYRGQKISCLKEAALTGKLLPGMLIHVKVHYNADPDYVPGKETDGHHWFIYMGMVDGEPMFTDNIRENKLRDTQTMDQIFNMSKYGERRITSIYDPFADQR